MHKVLKCRVTGGGGEKAVPDAPVPGMEIAVAPPEDQECKGSVGRVRGAHPPRPPQTQLVYGGEQSAGDALGKS